MPRGVKGSGPKKAVAVKRATAKSKAKPAAAVKAAKTAPPPAKSVPVVAIERDTRPLDSVDIDALTFPDELRAYATRLGVSPRDVQNLSEDRLRQNTKLFLVDHFELLTEG